MTTSYGSTFGDPSASTGGAHETGESAGGAKERAGQTASATKDAAASTAGTAKEQASQVAGTAKQKTSEVAGTAKEQAANVVGEARQQAGNVMGEVTSQISTQAITQRDKAAELLRSLSGEIGSMADGGEKPQNSTGMATSAARQIQNRMDDLAGYLERREPADLLDDVRDYARRRPGAFLLGAAVAGVVAGRMFKGATGGSDSSSRSSLPAMGGSAYDTGYDTGYRGTESLYGTGFDSPNPHGDPMTSATGDIGGEWNAQGQETGPRSPSTGSLSESNDITGSTYSSTGRTTS